MSFDPYAKFGPMAGLMGAISSKQRLISSNIANAQTPGYTAKGASFSELLFKQNGPYETALSQKIGSAVKPIGGEDTGKPVDLKSEMLAMQKNMLFYSMVTRRTSSIFSNLKAASQVGR